MSRETLPVDQAVVPVSGLLQLLMPTHAVGFAIKGLDGLYRLANPVIEALLCSPTATGASSLARPRRGPASSWCTAASAVATPG
jgi:hypothetical protein